MSIPKTPTQWELHHTAIRIDVKRLIENFDLADDQKREDVVEELKTLIDTLLYRVMHAEGIKAAYTLPIGPQGPMPQGVPISTGPIGMTVLQMIALCMHNGIDGRAIFLIPGGVAVSSIQVTPHTVRLW